MDDPFSTAPALLVASAHAPTDLFMPRSAHVAQLGGSLGAKTRAHGRPPLASVFRRSSLVDNGMRWADARVGIDRKKTVSHAKYEARSYENT